MKLKCLSLALTIFALSGCNIKPGNVVDSVDPANCAVRAVHIDAEASLLGYTSGRIDGTQVTFMNMKACPGLNLALPSPRDSSKIIGVTVPINNNGAAATIPTEIVK